MIEPDTLAAALRVTQGGQRRALQAMLVLAREAAYRDAIHREAAQREAAHRETVAAEATRRRRPPLLPAGGRRLEARRRSKVAGTQDHGHPGA